VIKFVPFSLFILIPGLELLLPPFLVVFPNSVPSQFLSEQAKLDKYKKVSERRDKAAGHLYNILPTYFAALEKDGDIIPEDIVKIKELRADLKKRELLPTDLLRHRDLFKRYGAFKFFSVDGLKRIAYFMSLEPITGVNIINNVLKVVKLKIDPSKPYIAWFSKMVMVRELNMYFDRIRKVDESISFEDLNKFSEEEIDELCFKRGIEINK